MMTIQKMKKKKSRMVLFLSNIYIFIIYKNYITCSVVYIKCIYIERERKRGSEGLRVSIICFSLILYDWKTKYFVLLYPNCIIYERLRLVNAGGGVCVVVVSFYTLLLKLLFINLLLLFILFYYFNLLYYKIIIIIK